jgi:toxin ParE1/3/4
MSYTVRFTAWARKDLLAIHGYIAGHDSMENANRVARQIVSATLSLRELPLRGSFPPELASMGNRRFRQIFFKPYRILYRVQAQTVFVLAIADGRRELHELLATRLLEK